MSILGCGPKQLELEEERRKIVAHYISSYNSFDVDGMVKDLSEDVVFKNVSAGKTDMELRGLDDFRNQAKTATNYFSKRKQTVKSWEFDHNQVIVAVDYTGILAIDLPNGMKKGDTLNLVGKSTFTFEQLSIISIVDES